MDKAHMVIVMGTETYGAKTNPLIDTYKEMTTMLAESKPFFLIKSCDRFSLPVTRHLLNFKTTAYVEWMPPRDQVTPTAASMPVNLAAQIEERLIKEFSPRNG